MMLKRNLPVWLFIVAGIVTALCHSPCQADLAAGNRFGNLVFNGASLSPEDRAYLGLNRPADFTLRDLQTRYVLVEIFSDSCPHCMLQAPVVNRVYRLIAGNPRLKGLKMLGVGYYGSPASMAKWRARYQTPFPLVPDSKGQFFRTVDAPGTPTYILFDTKGEVVFVHAGEIDSPQRFLRQVQAHLQ